MPFRSTKGASKQRRDQINTLVMELRALLPLHESTRQRLSQLQVMSLLCVHIRKNNVFRTAEENAGEDAWMPEDMQEGFLKNLPGFLLVVSKEGKLIHVSDNVTDYLGHSMVDMMTQGDSMYDIVDSRDHAGVQARLEEGWQRRDAGESHSTFFCRMNVARTLRRPCNFREQKVMAVRGVFAPLGAGEEPVFVAVCSPLLTPEVKDSAYRAATDLVWMEHSLDLKIQACSPHALQHLGYTEQELAGRSLYELLHPDHLAQAAQLHTRVTKLSADQGVMLAAQLQTAAGAWQPVSSVLLHQQGPDGRRSILSLHSLIRAEDLGAYAEQSRVYNEQARLMPCSLVHPAPGPRARPAPNKQMEQEPLLEGFLDQLVHAESVPPQRCNVEFKATGEALKRKLAEPRMFYPHKAIRLSDGMSGDEWEQSDMLELLTEPARPVPTWTAQVVSPGRLPMTPERSDEELDIGEILDLPSVKHELPVPSDSPAPSSVGSPSGSPGWLPPSPPQGSPAYSQGSPAYCAPQELRPTRPVVPMTNRRLLPEMGVNEVIDFFDEVQEMHDTLIPTTLSALHEDPASPPLKPLQADPRALQPIHADVLQKPEPAVYETLLDEVLSESEAETLAYDQRCQSLLSFLHEPMLDAQLDLAIAAF